MPRRRLERPRNLLAWSGGISVALHATILALMIITFPNKNPSESAAPTGVEMVFEPGNKTATAPSQKGAPIPARSAAPRGNPSPIPQRTVQAAPPPAPLPQPAVKPPTPVPPNPAPPVPKPVPAPKPTPTPPKQPVTKPPQPKPIAAAPKPPPPPLPKVDLPPPPPPAPEAPKTPAPIPAPVPLPSELTDNTPAEVNLNLPPMPELAPLNLPPPPPMPPTPPAPQKAVRARRSGNGRSNAFSQGVMVNGMSFNGGGGTGGQTQGSSLNLTTSGNIGKDNSVSIKGDPGTNWGRALDQWVNERIVYPEMAAAMGQQGSVTVEFNVDRAGHVSGLRMVTPTGYALLDQDWLGMFRNVTVPPFSRDAKSNSITVIYTMQYVLEH